MLKIAYIIIIALYIGIIISWLYRFPISYKIIGGNYNLIQNRDLTIAELDGLNRAYQIRQTISNILLYSSLLLSVGSFIILRNQWIKPGGIVKVVMYIAGFILVILILANSIHFIPGPPIR